jgi:hypothetical protein
MSLKCLEHQSTILIPLVDYVFYFSCLNGSNLFGNATFGMIPSLISQSRRWLNELIINDYNVLGESFHIEVFFIFHSSFEIPFCAYHLISAVARTGMISTVMRQFCANMMEHGRILPNVFRDVICQI